MIIFLLDFAILLLAIRLATDNFLGLPLTAILSICGTIGFETVAAMTC